MLLFAVRPNTTHSGHNAPFLSYLVAGLFVLTLCILNLTVFLFSSLYESTGRAIAVTPASASAFAL